MVIIRSAAVAALLVLGVGGCGASGSAVSGPYAGEVRAAREYATSDFERDVLKDGKITGAEWAEARARLVTCVADHGYVLELFEFGYQYGASAEDEDDVVGKIVDECARGTTATLESIYYGMTFNPQKEDEGTLIAACLVRHALVPEGFTGDDFDAAWADPNAPWRPKNPEDPEDPQVYQCEMNPKGL